MNAMMKRASWIAGSSLGAVALGWLGYAATAWYRYGKPTSRAKHATLLDRYMPIFEVTEHHEIRVGAPAAISYDAVRAMDLEASFFVRTIFRAREVLMRGTHPTGPTPHGLVEQTLALGWRVLAEEPGRQIVIGAATRPWESDPEFRGLSAAEFMTFDEPGYVKIAWTVGAEPLGPESSVVWTETRVSTTDADARARFRRYWSVFSPGILLIRREGLRVVRAVAERRYHAGKDAGDAARVEALVVK